MWRLKAALAVTGLMVSCLVLGCGDDDGVYFHNPLENPEDGPPAGYAAGGCSVPAALTIALTIWLIF